MAETRESALLTDVVTLKRDLEELRVDLEKKQELLTIMQALPAADRRELNDSTRTELREALRAFTAAFGRDLLPRLRRQGVAAPAEWWLSMEHLRYLAGEDVSGREDVAWDTFEMLEASLELTYDPAEEREGDPFGYEFGMEFQGNGEFHAAWTALLTAVARHTQVLLALYDPTSVEDPLLRRFEMVRAQHEGQASELRADIAACSEALLRATGKVAHSPPADLRLALSRANMRDCLRRL